MKPDPRYVSDFLEAVARKGGGADENFADHVRARLDHGEEEYGDNGNSARHRPLTELLSEIREEMADVPAWCLLAVQRSFDAEAEGSLPSEVGQALRVELVAWAAAEQALWQRASVFLTEHHRRLS